MLGVVGQPIVGELLPPAGVGSIGARIEVPVTRAIVSAWQPAILVTGPDGVVRWRAELESPLAAGEYLFVWRTADPEPPKYEAFVALTVSSSAAVR